MESYPPMEGRLRNLAGLVAATGLSPLIACLLDTGDRRLMLVFEKWWHKETSSFHLPVGEVTITLDDVASLLHFSIIGAFRNFDSLHIDEAILLLVELLEKKQELKQYNAMGNLLGYPSCETYIGANVTQHSCTLFANKSATQVHVNFNDASKRTVRQLVGYITLLQCWIYEHFPFVSSSIVAKDYHERKPCGYYWKSRKALLVSMSKHLDRLTSDVVCWIPYGDHREFKEYVTIPPHSAAPSLCIKDINDIWIQFSEYIAPPVVHDHTFVEPDVPQHPMAAAAMNEAPANAHVDEACQAIHERFERLLNLRIVIEGTEAYTVTEDCLRISRGVIAQRNVYVHSRRR
ncbi:hypothetical protein HKD37_20G055574 [Glycine soja]